MKKVLILSVIAMLALGVMALAGTISSNGTNGPVTTGATCSTSGLQVTSNVVVVQGFVATATAYDATFCGATGNPLKYTSPTYNSNYVLLASLTVKSNMATIGVAFEAYSPNNVIDTLTGSTCGFYYYANGGNTYNNGGGVYLGYTNWPSWWSPSNPTQNFFTLSLLGSQSPYEGELDVLMPNGVIPPWIQAGEYTLTMSFLVFPKTSGF